MWQPDPAEAYVLMRLCLAGTGIAAATVPELTAPAVGLRRPELRRALARMVIHGLVRAYGRTLRLVYEPDERDEERAWRWYERIRAS